MKTFTLTFWVLLSTISSYSQEFGTLNSEWIYNYNGTWSQGVTIVKYEKDTIIFGELTQVYTKQAIRKGRQSMDSATFKLHPIYIRSNNGIILISEKGEVFDTLINYKAEIGRTWKINKRYNDNSIASSIKVTILDTFRTNFSGVSLFAQAARYTWQFFDYVDTVYEYMGSRYHYIIPFDEIEVAVDGGEGGEIKCYKNDKIGLVTFNYLRFGGSYQYDCNNLLTNTGFINKIIKLPIKYWFNNSNLKIENNSNITYVLKVIDITGQPLLVNCINSGINNYKLNNMPKGIYLLLANENYLGRIIN